MAVNTLLAAFFVALCPLPKKPSTVASLPFASCGKLYPCSFFVKKTISHTRSRLLMLSVAFTIFFTFLCRRLHGIT